MKLSTKGRYAMVAMADLALQGAGELTNLTEISKRQDISLPYLEQLFVKLRRAGLVDSVRGPGGGYQLGREASAISVSDVISAVDESVDATRCQGKSDCHGGTRCLTHTLWSDLSHRIEDFLTGITLGELVTQHDVQNVAKRQNSRIVKNPATDIEVSCQL